MKKKLLLITLLVALFACIFVIAANAGEIVAPTWPEKVETIEGMSDKSVFGKDGTVGATSRVLMSDGKAYPAYYVCANAESLALDFSELSAYTKADIVAIELPKGITKVTTALKECTSLRALIIPEGCTEIVSQAMKGNTSLTYVEIPYTFSTGGYEAFVGCTAVTDVYCKSTILSERMFYNCPLVKNVKLENTVTISKHAFCNTTTTISNKQTQIDSLVLPDTVQSIGTYAFARCKITEIVLPASLETIGSNAFNSCSQLKKAIVLGPVLGEYVFNQCSSLSELVLTENIEEGKKDAINGAASSFTTYYTGSDPSVITTLFGGTSRIDKATIQPYNADGNYTGSSKIIYNCNLCVVAFGGNHTSIDDGDCTTAVICSMCKKVECKAAMAEHVNGEKLVYTSLLSKGEHFVGCTNDGCKLGTSTEVPALFICLGYSTELEGYGIVCEFSVNVDAIGLYKSLVDPDFDYGMVVAIGNSSPLSKDENGNVAPIDKAVACSFVNTNYSRLQIKIANITEDKFSTEIVSTLYVCTNNEIGYVNDGKIEKTAIGKTYTELKK